MGLVTMILFVFPLCVLGSVEEQQIDFELNWKGLFKPVQISLGFSTKHLKVTKIYTTHAQRELFLVIKAWQNCQIAKLRALHLNIFFDYFLFLFFPKMSAFFFYHMRQNVAYSSTIKWTRLKIYFVQDYLGDGLNMYTYEDIFVFPLHVLFFWWVA